MTKKEYIESLVEQGLTAKEIQPLADAYIEKPTETEEEVKTEVVADNTDAAVTTTPENATEEKSMDSPSRVGSSEYLTAKNAATRGVTKTRYIESLKSEGKTTEEVKALADEWEKNNSVEQGTSSQPVVNYRPGQTLQGDDDMEYKFTLDPKDKTKGIYYSRKKGEDNWTNLSTAKQDDTGNSQAALASAAYLFGHNEFDEEARSKYFKSIADQKAKIKADKKAAFAARAKADELGVLGLITGGDGFQMSDIFDIKFDDSALILY